MKLAEPCRETDRYSVSVSVHLTMSDTFANVNELEVAILAAVRQGAVQLYDQAFRAFQEQWVQARSDRYLRQRWRAIDWLTPHGTIRLPVRVVRHRATGAYLTLSKVLFRHQATRRLSPALEAQACLAATELNYRPAARTLSRWIGQRVGPWLVWGCVQFYGLRRLIEREKLPPPRPDPQPTPVLISELDATWIQVQQRARTAPVRHFPVYLGLHYTGRARRYQARGSPSVTLQNKRVMASTEPLARFGRRFELAARRQFQPQMHVVVTDGDPGLKQWQQRAFPDAPWLLDRWHIAQALRAFTGPEAAEFARLWEPIQQADAAAALAALRQSPLRHQRPEACHTLETYLTENQAGIDAWRRIPASLRRGRGRRPPAVKAGSGAVEKNIEVRINRRFKGQGRSWSREGAERLLQLTLLPLDTPESRQWFVTPSPFRIPRKAKAKAKPKRPAQSQATPKSNPQSLPP